MDTKFIAVFNAFKNDIYRLVFSYTKNKYDTDDITQNVFTKLYENFDKFKTDEHIKKWLIKVAINECKDYFSSSWKKKTLPMSENIEDNLFASIKHDNLYEPIFSLPDKYRIVIHLYYYEGYKINEIASILKKKETTIKSLLSRARTKLREIHKGGIENER